MAGSAGTIPQRGTDRPSMRFLHRYVASDVAPYWLELGYFLRINDSDLTMIQKDYPYDSKSSCVKMLRSWLEQNVTASWNQLIEALRDIDLNVVSDSIERMLIQPKPEITKYLSKAKHDKKVVDFKHIKILLTGSSAAGKSSFCRLLFRLKLPPEYNSTDFLENKQALPVVRSRSEDKKQAVTVKSFSMLKQEEEVVWLELDLKYQIKYLKSLLESKRFHDQETSIPSLENDEDENDSDDDIDETDLDREIIASESLSDSLKIETVKLITVVDTGGQPEYIHLLPAINSYPAITFIVHNLTKTLDDPVQVRYKKIGCEEDPVQILNYSNLDMIHLLMSFVSDSLEHQPEIIVPNVSVLQKPYIGFVGTHYDKVKNNPSILKDINNKLVHMVDERSFQCGGVLSPEEGIIFPVDNTTAGDTEKEDPLGKVIRGQIEHFTNQIETKTLPITWMILQLRLQEMCVTHHKKYIPFEEYLIIAKENACICDKDEIRATLAYFHCIGLLLYFEYPDLCGYIIISLQWLYTNLAKVMHLSSKHVTIYDGKLRKKFNDQRLLPSKQADCKINLRDVSQQELEYFFNLLMHLKVIAVVTIDSTDFYYLPCVLSNLRMCDDKHKHLLSEPLLIQFTSGFLPRGFFCSLVVHLLNDQPKGWEHQLHRSAKNFSDLMIFCLPDNTYLYMHDKVFYLKLEVRHGRKKFDASYHSKLFNVLNPYLISVCEQLNFAPNKLQYGFLCLADEKDYDHIAVIDLSKDSKMMLNKCSRQCSYITTLDEYHTIWFEELLFNKSSQQRDSQSNINANSSADIMHDDQFCTRSINLKTLSRLKFYLAVQWKNIAFELIKEQNVLNIASSQDTLEEKCFKMLETWRQSNEKPCYCQLFHALEIYEYFYNIKKVKELITSS